MKNKYAIIILCLISIGVKAQVLPKAVKWTFESHKLSANTYELLLTAIIDKPWHIYSQYIADGGPVKTSFKFIPAKGYTLQGNVTELSIPVKVKEPAFDNMELIYFENKAIFKQVIKVMPGTFVVNGSLEYMRCNDKQCFHPKLFLSHLI